MALSEALGSLWRLSRNFLFSVTISRFIGIAFFRTATTVVMNDVAVEPPVLVLDVRHIDPIDISNTLPKSKTKPYPERKGSLKGVVWHHTATPSSAGADAVRRIKSIANYHVENNKWGAVAYHRVIDSVGTLYLTNDYSIRTNHAPGYNETHAAIALLGNYDLHDLPDRVKRVIDVIWIENESNGLEQVLHSDTKATACPGSYARSYLRSISEQKKG